MSGVPGAKDKEMLGNDESLRRKKWSKYGILRAAGGTRLLSNVGTANLKTPTMSSSKYNST